MNGFEDYSDDAGYSGHCMGDLFDSVVDAVTLGPLRRAVSGDDPTPPSLDDNSGSGIQAGEAQVSTQQGGFPSWAGSPAVFQNRVAKLNAVMGTGFNVNTLPTDKQLMGVVAQFQRGANLTADGKMGPNTEAGLDARLGGAQPVTPPAAPIAVVPQNAAPSGAATPVVAKDASGDRTKLFLALGIGGVALLGLGYFALKD